MFTQQIRMNGTPVVNVLEGKYVSSSNPMPVTGNVDVSASSPLPVNGEVSISGVANVNVSNGNPIRTSVSNTPNVNISSVSSGVTFSVNSTIQNEFLPVLLTEASSITLSGVTTTTPVPVKDIGDYSVSSSGGVLVTNTGFNPSSSGWFNLCSPSNQRVRLSIVGNSSFGGIGLKGSNGEVLILPVGGIIDLLGAITDTLSITASDGFIGELNSADFGAYVTYWLYS